MHFFLISALKCQNLVMLFGKGLLQGLLYSAMQYSTLITTRSDCPRMTPAANLAEWAIETGRKRTFVLQHKGKTEIEQLEAGWVYTRAAPSPNLTCQLHLQVTLAWNPSIYPRARVHPSVCPATHQSWIGSISFKPFHTPFTTDNSFCVCRGAALSIAHLWSYCARASSFLVSKWHQLTDTMSESCHRSWGASFRHVRPLGIGIGFPQTPLSKD